MKENTVFSLKEEFLKEFFQLLKKYNAEIRAEDHWLGYPECGQDIRMTVEFNDTYEEIDLGGFIDQNKNGGSD